MDNVGDWLYIVFLIIAGISGLFGSKNKKKSPKKVASQPDKDVVTQEEKRPGKSFWDVWEEMQNQSLPQQQPADPPKKRREKLQTKKPAQFLTAETTADRMAADVNRLPPPSMEEENLLADIEFDDRSELRKAIIYTEILNRKY